MAIALAFIVLVAAILFVLESMTKGSRSHETIAKLRHRWPSIASNLVLRLVSLCIRYAWLGLIMPPVCMGLGRGIYFCFLPIYSEMRTSFTCGFYHRIWSHPVDTSDRLNAHHTHCTA